MDSETYNCVKETLLSILIISTMKRIEKKVWPEYFQLVADGVKMYELRLADFDCKPGDTLVLKEWDPQTKEYTGRELEKQVTFVGKTKGQTFWSQEEVEQYGFQVISFK